MTSRHEEICGAEERWPPSLLGSADLLGNADEDTAKEQLR